MWRAHLDWTEVRLQSQVESIHQSATLLESFVRCRGEPSSEQKLLICAFWSGSGNSRGASSRVERRSRHSVFWACDTRGSAKVLFSRDRCEVEGLWSRRQVPPSVCGDSQNAQLLKESAIISDSNVAINVDTPRALWHFGTRRNKYDCFTGHLG